MPGLTGSPSQYNPIYYYYYTQMLMQTLQAQQKILEMNNSAASVTTSNNNNSSVNSMKDILSPLKLGKDSNQVRGETDITLDLFLGLNICC